MFQCFNVSKGILNTVLTGRYSENGTAKSTGTPKRLDFFLNHTCLKKFSLI